MSAGQWNAEIPTNSKKFSRAGLLFLLIFGGGGGYWSYTAPLESAVIATGSFTTKGANKVVQHLEGGIVKKILIKEGDKIKAGDILIHLDRTKADAEYERLKKRNIQLLAYQARLKWEINLGSSDKVKKGSSRFPLPTKGSWKKGTRAYEIYEAQVSELQAGLNSRKNQIRRLQKQKKAEKRKLSGVISVRKALQRRLDEMNRQIQKKNRLLKRGLTTRDKLDNLILSQSQEQASLSENLSQSEQSEERILEIDQGIESVDLTNREKQAIELRTTNNELSDVQERLLQAKNVAERVFIRAPVDGVIVQLSVNTENSVIAPGQQIMEILPAGNELQIEIYIPPTDRDDVTKGQLATIQLPALPQRTAPTLQGTVSYVSADLIKSDNKQDLGSFVTRINLTKEDLQKVLDLKILPGMPASVFIKTGSQTFWEYLSNPIKTSIKQALSEKS